MTIELNSFGYPKQFSMAVKYDRKNKRVINIQQISEDMWKIDGVLYQPIWVSDDGERFTFKLNRRGKIVFSRNTSTKEIGDVLLFGNYANTDKLIAVYN